MRRTEALMQRENYIYIYIYIYIFLTNRLDLFSVQVAQSLVKTKHKTLIINSKYCAKAVKRLQRTTVKLLDYTPVVYCYLRQALTKYNWSGFTGKIDCGNDDSDAIYDDFIQVIKWHINCIVPTRDVTIRERDRSYITHHIKLLLLNAIS